MPLPEVVFEPSSSYEDALHKAAEEWGIEREFWDIFGKRHVASAAMESRILSALGLDTSSQKTIEDKRVQRFQRRVMLPFQPVSITNDVEKWIILSLAKSYTSADIELDIRLESGEQLRANHKLSQLKIVGVWRLESRPWCAYLVALPPEVPQGYHTLQVKIDDPVVAEGRLIVAPNRAFRPKRLSGDGKCAGLAITLYGLRSGRNWGCGD